MRKFVNVNETGDVLIVGMADEIKAVAKSLRRAERKTNDSFWKDHNGHRTNLEAEYLSAPKFNMSMGYGLYIDWHGHWIIISATDVLMVLGAMDGGVKNEVF